MRKWQNRWLRFDAKNLSEEANQKFVQLGQYLLYLASWPKPSRMSPRERRKEKELPILSRSEELRQKTRDLFHQDADCRLAAVRCLRMGRFVEAQPILEGVLVIEENKTVRDEMIHALEDLSSCREPQEVIS